MSGSAFKSIALTRRQLLAGCAGLTAAAACGGSRSRQRHDGAVSAEAVAAAPSADPAVLAWLETAAVYDDDFVRRVFYSWTHAEQIAELRDGASLISRTHARDGAASLFDSKLGALVEKGGERIAELLLRPGLRRRRFAWSNPWATRPGWGDTDYGDRLLRVELRPGSYVGSLDPRWGWRFRTLDDELVELRVALAHPERIAAIYHVHPGDDSTPPFREYVLCNESMIAELQVGSAEIAAVIAESVAMLGRLRGELDGESGAGAEAAWRAALVAAWRSRSEPATLAQLYRANLAFASPALRLEAGNVAALVAALADLPVEAPLARVPSVAFVLGRRSRPGRRPATGTCADPTMCPPPRKTCGDPTFCP